MEVILIENVEGLGTRGQTVKVAGGYGRNHLLPKKMAVAATPQNRKWVEQQRQRFLKQEAKEKADAEELAGMLAGEKLVFTRKAGEHGALFGSVTAMDITEALAARGYKLDRRKVQLSAPLKAIGEHDVAVRLHREVTAKVKVTVEIEGGKERSTEEAAPPEPAKPVKPAGEAEVGAS